MADYIKREDALQAVIDCWEPWFGSKPAGDIVRCPYFAINKIPSADVVPREDYERACITLNKIAEVLRDG